MPTGNKPSTIDSVLSTDILTSLNINKPDVYMKLVRARGDQGLDYFDLIKALGYVQPVSQEKVTHFEDDFLTETFHSNTTVTQNTPGGTLAVILSAIDLDTNRKFFPRQFDIVMLPNRVTCSIVSIAGAGTATVTLTLKPNSQFDVIGTINSGQELIITSNAFSEDSDQPDGAVTKTRQFDVYLQIVKESFITSGSAATNNSWFTQVSDGEDLQGYFVKGQKDMDYRMRKAIMGALLWQKQTDNAIVDPNNGSLIQTTLGLDPYIRQYGNTVNYTAGLFNVKKFDTITKIQDKEFVPGKSLVLAGIDLDIEIENSMVDYFANTNIQFAKESVTESVFGGHAGMAAEVGFQYLIKGQRTYCFRRMAALSHPKMTGAAGYSQAGLGYVIPLGNKKDAQTGDAIPYIGMVYKQLGNNDRMLEIWDVSGAGPVKKVIGRDRAQYFMRGHFGARHMAGNQMIVLQNG